MTHPSHLCLFLFQAVCRNNYDTVKLLLECGANSLAKDVFGHTPVDNAKSNNLQNIVLLLEEFSMNGCALKLRQIITNS